MISVVKLLHILLGTPLLLFTMVKPELTSIKESKNNLRVINFPSRNKHLKKELVVRGLEIGDRARDGSKKVKLLV